MGKYLQTFRSKVIILTLVVVLGTQFTTVFSVLIASYRDFNDRANEEILDGSKIFEKLKENRTFILRQVLLPLAEDSKFLSAIGYGFTDDINREMGRRAAWIGADIAILTDNDGKIITTTGVPVTPSLKVSELGSAGHTTIELGGRYFDMVSVPLASKSDTGYISMGFAINDVLAQRFASIAGLEMTLMAISADGEIKLLGSSLSRDQRNLILNTGRQIAGGMSPRKAADAMSSEYLSIRVPYLKGREDISAVLQVPLAEAKAPFESLQGTMLHAAATSILCALILAIYLSRSVTRPVRKLLVAARRMRIGNYKGKLNIQSRDEFGELAKAFNSMRESISERERRIVYHARYDSLTGLPNRDHGTELLRSALKKADKNDSNVTVIVMQLHRFREIQSSLGHKIGDEVQRLIALRIRENLNESNIFCRLESNQFLIVSPDTDIVAAKELATNLTKLFDSDLTVQTINVSLDVRIGIAVSPAHGRLPDELLRRASVAKNDAQSINKRIRTYQTGREAKHVRQLAILGDLRRAVNEGELKLFLQPKINLMDDHVCGAEALLRWDHPEFGEISPKEFIPLAENAGSISIVTEWVLCQAVQECTRWQEQDIKLPIAVNLSSQDLLNRHLPDMIRQELRAHGVPASAIILEITEEAAVKDIYRSAAVLKQLRAMGIRVSMDDFGTGYSSLSQLQQLEFDELKIDKSFISCLPDDDHNAAIVRSMIELAHNLKLEVVAEGVESAATLRWLNDHGCERAQGYYFSPAIPSEECANWIKNWERFAAEEPVSADPSESIILKPRPVT